MAACAVAFGILHEIHWRLEIHPDEIVIFLLAAHHFERVILENPVVTVVRNYDSQVEVVTGGSIQRVGIVEIRAIADEPDDVTGILLLGFGEGGPDRSG